MDLDRQIYDPLKGKTGNPPHRTVVSCIRNSRLPLLRTRRHESVRISVRARVLKNGSLFQSFLYAFAVGDFVRNIARCP